MTMQAHFREFAFSRLDPTVQALGRAKVPCALAYVVLAYTVMTYTFLAYIAMAYAALAYMVMSVLYSYGLCYCPCSYGLYSNDLYRHWAGPRFIVHAYWPV